MIKKFSFGTVSTILVALILTGAASTAEARQPAPTALTATAISTRTIVLGWTEDDVVTSFSIERSVVADRDFAEIVTVGADVRSYSDTGLPKSTTFYYRIRALYGGTYSRRTDIVSATTAASDPPTATPTPLTTATPPAANAPPSAPSGFVGTAATCTQVNATWNASSAANGKSIKGYNLYRNDTFVKTVPSTSTGNAGLSPSTTYGYAVSALDSSGLESAKTATKLVTTPACDAPPTATATDTPTPKPSKTAIPSRTATATPMPTATPTRTVTATPKPTATPTRTATATPMPMPTATPSRTATATPKPTTTLTRTVTATPMPTATPDSADPSVPTGLRAQAMTCNQINLSWNASTDTGGSGLKGYNLYRSGTFVKQIAAPAISTSNAGLSGGTVYSYTVSAIDNAGNESNASNAASVNTPLCNQPPVANAGQDVSATAGAPVTVNGTASSDSDGSIVSYAWTFGDGTNGSGASTTHAYAAAGTYTVTLTVTDNAGAQATDTALARIATAVPGAHLRSQRFGGTLADSAYAAAVDANGNVVVTGEFADRASFGGATLSSAGGADIFIAKYTAAGAHVWSKRIGGTGSDRGEAIAVDANGDVLVTGDFDGTADFGMGPVTSSGRDIFVAKYAGATGAHLWSKRFGNTGDDFGYGIAVDASGNVIVTGMFASSVDFGGGTLTSSYASADAFLAKFSSDGTHLWSKRFGDSSVDVGQGVAVDAAGNIALTGSFSGTVDFGTGAVRSNDGSDDIFVAKFSSAGQALWTRSYGDVFGDAGCGVAMDPTGNVVVVGTFRLTADFGGGPMTSNGNTPADIFLLKLNAQGGHVWSKHFGGPSFDSGHSVVADSAGNVIIAGYFQGDADFGTGTLSSAGGYDGVIAKYSSAGATLWSKRFGDVDTDYGLAVATTKSNDVVLAGAFSDIANVGGADLVSAGDRDVILATFAP